jgi:hypothetical protein
VKSELLLSLGLVGGWATKHDEELISVL